MDIERALESSASCSVSSWSILPANNSRFSGDMDRTRLTSASFLAQADLSASRSVTPPIVAIGAEKNCNSCRIPAQAFDRVIES
jgi:hypothetical protein